jgi:hypothetical protein
VKTRSAENQRIIEAMTGVQTVLLRPAGTQALWTGHHSQTMAVLAVTASDHGACIRKSLGFASGSQYCSKLMPRFRMSPSWPHGLLVSRKTHRRQLDTVTKRDPLKQAAHRHHSSRDTKSEVARHGSHR